jgi:tight adherence protein B
MTLSLVLLLGAGLLLMPARVVGFEPRPPDRLDRPRSRLVLAGDRLKPRSAPTKHDPVPFAMALAAELRAGVPPGSALGVASELYGSNTMSATMALGGDAATAYSQSDHETQLERSIAVAWSATQSTGVALAEVIEQLAEGELAARTIQRALTVEVSGPKHSARVVAGLPGLGLIFAMLLGADPLSWLLTTSAGLGTLTVGLVLNGVGALWALRIYRGVQALV